MVRHLSIAAAVIGFLAVVDAAAQQSAPGRTFKECRNCPEMVVIPTGSFMMGSPANEPDRRENEPQRKVTIARAFAIGKTEVTWDQWEACVRDRRCDGPGVDQALRTNEDGTPNKVYEDWGRGARPVVGVSWFDAQNFVGWLNSKTGGDDAYRLPSEAEWEYAARAGTTTAYPWRTRLDHNYGNFGGVGPGLGGKAEGRDERRCE
jgi:formylglycine-generating enzyme required for sulfatase activity